MSNGKFHLILILSLGLSLGVVANAQNWPSFRGEFARGVTDGQDLPLVWDVESGRNVRWKTAIPGMGHSSPIVWGDRVFVTAAVSPELPPLVLGDEGGIDLAQEGAVHSWRLYSLDKRTGRILWFREAFSGKPRAARHVKASQANATPVTDGKSVVGIFGSQGLAVFDFDGNLKWKVDLGVLDPGLFGDKSSQWGHASSPILYRGLVFVQVDRHNESYLAAFNLETGEKAWSVARDEKPVWATPTLHESPERAELIVVGGDYDRGYDPVTGSELWRFARDYEVKTPTPFVAGNLVVLAGGYRGQPLYALRVGAVGDISASREQGRGEFLAWTSEPGGPYTSTPLAYGELLYFVRNTGILTVLSLESGDRIYRQRMESAYSASPVASDGRIYLIGEEGVISIVQAGREFKLLGSNDMGEPCMATPAISEGTLFLRTRSSLYALAEEAARN
jgi:outer membrane protein assembly factor BamB